MINICCVFEIITCYLVKKEYFYSCMLFKAIFNIDNSHKQKISRYPANPGYYVWPRSDSYQRLYWRTFVSQIVVPSNRGKIISQIWNGQMGNQIIWLMLILGQESFRVYVVLRCVSDNVDVSSVLLYLQIFIEEN